MAIRVYCSLNYSRLGIEIYEPQAKERKLGKTKFHKIVKDNSVRWIHVHEPSQEYLLAKKRYLKTFKTGCTDLKMGEWIAKRKREREELENRCAVLAARIFRYAKERK